MLRHRGLRDWLVHVATASRPQSWQAELAASPFLPAVAKAEHSPLLGLCTDLLVTRLMTREDRS